MELKVLDYLVDRGGSAPYGDILNAFPAFLDTKGVLLLLKMDGYIEGPLTSCSSVSITVLGRGYRLRLQQQENQRSEEIAEMRADQERSALFDKKQLIFNWVNVILVFLTLAATVYTIFH